MQIEALKVFCDVARCRSFSQAAQARGITQSAVSQIVSQLEKRVQAQLVDRSTRPLHLTPPGQKFYDGCKALLQQYDELEASIRSASDKVAGQVQVAAIYSVGLGDIQEYVQEFTARHGEAQVHIEYLHPDRVYEHVLDGTADLGLVSFPRKSPKLAALSWREEEMVLVCAPNHGLAGQEMLRLKELAEQKYVHFERNLVIRRRVDRFLREHDVAVDVVLEFDSIENIKQAVGLGAGVALLPEPTVRREVRAGTLAALHLVEARFTRPLGIIHRRQRLSAAARAFLDLLLEHGSGRLHGTPSGNGRLSGGAAHPPRTLHPTGTVNAGVKKK